MVFLIPSVLITKIFVSKQKLSLLSASSLPLSFWDATRQSGRECQRPNPGTSWTGEHLQGRGGPGSLLISTKLGLRGSPLETGISLLLLSAQLLKLHGKVQLLKDLPCHFLPIRPLLPLRILFSVPNMFIYLRRSALCHLLLEGFLDSSAKCSFVFPWQCVPIL